MQYILFVYMRGQSILNTVHSVCLHIKVGQGRGYISWILNAVHNVCLHIRLGGVEDTLLEYKMQYILFVYMRGQRILNTVHSVCLHIKVGRGDISWILNAVHNVCLHLKVGRGRGYIARILNENCGLIWWYLQPNHLQSVWFNHAAVTNSLSNTDLRDIFKIGNKKTLENRIPILKFGSLGPKPPSIYWFPEIKIQCFKFDKIPKKIVYNPLISLFDDQSKVFNQYFTHERKRNIAWKWNLINLEHYVFYDITFVWVGNF